MASWLQAQLKAAEGLLEGFDKSVSQTVSSTRLGGGAGGHDGDEGEGICIWPSLDAGVGSGFTLLAVRGWVRAQAVC